MSDIAIYQASVPDRMRYAEALSGSSLLPRDYVGKPANVLLAIEYGAALGIPPMTAIQGVHIINGKPTASAGLIGALVRKAGHRLRVTGDDRHAVCEIVRADDPDFTFRSEWTWDRAVAAKLTGKDTWKAYPAAMLKARAITECARDACPEALAGVAYTPEELGDDSQHADSYPVTVEDARPVERLTTIDPDDPWTAETPEVLEAEVVGEDDGASVGGEAADAPSTRGPGYDANTGARIPYGPGALIDPKSQTSKKMYLLLRMIGDTNDQRAWLSARVGREITSSKELTQGEQSHIVDQLVALEATS